eukprot:Seg2517.5 transcript_id=Seg2517.5/GoldUCD/mRNA.D3Y31 product="Mitochondrial import inner membrane translocase subunit Tim29" protein_id=Seg2517.5/GoldUCD/D3Y31
MASWRQVKKVNQALFPQFESLKQGRLAKVYYLVKDYKAVGASAIEYARKRPIKVILQLSTLGLGSYSYTKNPNLQSYEDNLKASAHQLLQVSSLIRNKNSESYVNELMESLDQNRLTWRSFGIFSVLLKNEFSQEYDSVNKNCYYVQPRWLNIYDRIVDIGFLDRWFLLEKAMEDYDINDEEFANTGLLNLN